MANLTYTDFPLGWTPSADPVNGDPRGLLRMDNLQRDEQGAITLIRGYKSIATFSDYVSDIYSKAFQSGEAVYVGLNENGHSLYRSANGLFTDTTTNWEQETIEPLFWGCFR